MKIHWDRKAIQYSLIYLIIVISFFDNFSHIPIMSTFAQSLGADLFLASVIVSAYSMSNMVGNLYSGFLIDKFGRRICMTYGFLFSSLAVIGYSLVNTTNQLFIMRIFHGLGMAVVIPAAFALIGDISSANTRGKDMARSGIAISIAALLGPPIGGMLSTLMGLNFLFYFAALLLFLGALSCRYLIRANNRSLESPVNPSFEQNEPYLEGPDDNGERSFKQKILKPELVIAYLAAFFLMVAKGTLVFALPIVSKHLGFTASTTGILFSSFAIAAIIVFISPFNRISDKEGRFKPVVLGLFLISLALGLLGLGDNLTELIIIMSIYGIGFGILFPASTALVVDFTEFKDRGKGFGIFYAVFSLGVVVGPVFTGYLATWINPFHSASILVFIGLVPIGILYNKTKKTKLV